jgi:hypothetical protein
VASPNFYSSGIGGSTGDDLATVSPLHCSGSVWYVGSATTGAADAASPRGKERIRPLATLAQAVTNAAANDIIVLLASHTETLTGVQTLNLAGLTIISEGSGSTRARFTRNADAVLFNITADNVTLGNIYFVASSTTSTNARVKTANANTRLIDCYFESDESDTGPAFETVTGAGSCHIVDTTFASTATAPDSQPESAIKFTNAISDVFLSNVVVNGASSGWSNPYAINGAGAITRLRGLNVDLKGDSDVTFATGTTGYLHVRTSTGSTRVVWAA